jgi:hypothetical protein
MATKVKPKVLRAVISTILVPPGVDGFLRKAQVATMLSVSMSTFKGMLARKEYPLANRRIGKMPLWTVEVHNQWCRRQAVTEEEG